jgi:hypothetical protein
MSAETPLNPTDFIPAIALPRHFRIEVRGVIDQGWLAAFDPLSFSSSEEVTRIEVLADQAGLRGILNRLWDLNLDILSVVAMALPAVRDGGKQNAKGNL